MQASPAVVTLAKVTESRLAFFRTSDWPHRDINGVYGQPGRVVRRGPLTGALDPVRGGTLTASQDTLFPDRVRFSLKVNYLLEYDVYDNQSGQLLARERQPFQWSHSGYSEWPKTDWSRFSITEGWDHFGPAPGGVIKEIGLVRTSNTNPWLQIDIVDGAFVHDAVSDAGGVELRIIDQPGFETPNPYAEVRIGVRLAPVAQQ